MRLWFVWKGCHVLRENVREHADTTAMYQFFLNLSPQFGRPNQYIGVRNPLNTPLQYVAKFSILILMFIYRNASIKRPGRLLNFLNF